MRSLLPSWVHPHPILCLPLLWALCCLFWGLFSKWPLGKACPLSPCHHLAIPRG